MNYQVGQVIFQSMRILHKEKKGTQPPLGCFVDSSFSELHADQAQWEQGDSASSFMVNSNLHLAVLPSTAAGLLPHCHRKNLIAKDEG